MKTIVRILAWKSTTFPWFLEHAWFQKITKSDTTGLKS